MAVVLTACSGKGSMSGLDGNSTLSISDKVVGEDAGNMIFTVTRSGLIMGTATVNYSTADGTAVAGSDYSKTSGTLTFYPGETTHTIAVPIIDDSISELTETLLLNLSNPANATIAASPAVGTIMDNELPILAVSDVIAAEDAGDMIFNVTRSGLNGGIATVNYSTVSGTATAGSDYTAVSGTLTFDPGEAIHTIAVPIIDDSTVETNETLFVHLTGATNATLVTPSAAGTIVDNDAPSSFGIANALVAENAGDMVFTVTRSGSTVGAAAVNYSTLDGSALAGSDYTAVSGTLTFNPGETVHTLVVPIIDDSVVEPSETLFLDLSDATGAPIASAMGTIVDND